MVQHTDLNSQGWTYEYDTGGSYQEMSDNLSGKNKTVKMESAKTTGMLIETSK